jgi:hypothetical protein
VKPRSYYVNAQGQIEGGPRVTFRMSPCEAKQLIAVATSLGTNVSQVIRDALYDQHQIGEFEPSDAGERLPMSEKN